MIGDPRAKIAVVKSVAKEKDGKAVKLSSKKSSSSTSRQPTLSGFVATAKDLVDSDDDEMDWRAEQKKDEIAARARSMLLVLLLFDAFCQDLLTRFTIIDQV